MNTQQLSDLYEIQRLKARYFRHMDLRQWDEWRDVFTDDLLFFIEDARTPVSEKPTFVGPDDLVAFVSTSPPETISIHQGHMPEIDFVDADHATGIWAMFDWVDEPGRSGAWKGYGHYYEQYRRCEDGHWRICSVHLTRLRRNPVESKPSQRNSLLQPDGLLGRDE
jgi:hypothetical protein